MILVERDPTLPPYRDAVKAKFLIAMRTMHELFEFGTTAELVEYLEKGLDELKAAGYPRKLSRIVLVYHTESARLAVEERMHPAGEYTALHAPGCWMMLAPRLPQIIRYARTIEPGWLAEMLKGEPHVVERH